MMKKSATLLILAIMGMTTASAQTLTPEILWKLGRVTAVGLSKDRKAVVYKVSTPSVEENKSETKYYTVPVTGGAATEIKDHASIVTDKNVSPDGKYIVYHESVKVEKILAKEIYPELKKADAQIYNGLDYRHWDTWNEGSYNHVFFRENRDKSKGTDIMKGEAFNSPQAPFGGDEDYIWSPDSKKILYVTKKKSGTEYAVSTNTDIYEYDIASGQTINRTAENPGYDTHPAFSPAGHLTWLQMKRDGYEADKNDIIVDMNGVKQNLTANWDGTVDSFEWSPDGKKVYFTAPIMGTKQLFEVNFPGKTKIAPVVRQLTEGMFDVNGIAGFAGNLAIIPRTDMNHST